MGQDKANIGNYRKLYLEEVYLPKKQELIKKINKLATDFMKENKCMVISEEFIREMVEDGFPVNIWISPPMNLDSLVREHFGLDNQIGI